MNVNLKEILQLAEEKKCAVGSFNTPNQQSLQAVIAAAEELQQPVILMHAQLHEEMGLCTMDEIVPMMLRAAERAAAPVCVHLDHGTDLEYIKRGLELGVNAVMYDGSELPIEENLANTCLAVAMAQKTGASVEAEVGSMGTREGGGEGGESRYTDPELAKRFAEETGIDALACTFGTAHGLYSKAPELDFERVRRIHSIMDVPLVMHGGSGVSTEDYQKVIAFGIRKINYYTYMAKAGGEAISGKQFAFWHDAAAAAVQAMKQDVIKAVRVFGCVQ